MHEYLLSLFLGVVEGLTEFLPVSSTAHLRITEALLHINLEDPFWEMYSIVIQLGAILCLPIYFRARIARFLELVQSASITLGIVLLLWLPYCLFCLPEWLAAVKRALTAPRPNDDKSSTLT